MVSDGGMLLAIAIVHAVIWWLIEAQEIRPE
jgi:hypothetical protein